MLRKGLQKDQNSFLLRIRVLPAEWGGDCQLGGVLGDTVQTPPHTQQSWLLGRSEMDSFWGEQSPPMPEGRNIFGLDLSCQGH